MSHKSTLINSPEKHFSMNAIGPYSHPATLAKLDQRTREARLMRQTREALVQHLGGKPSATEKLLIERAANLQLRIATMDRKFSETGEMTEHDTRTYLAWTGSLSRLLRDLGLKGTPPKPPTVAEVMARGGKS
jgi:hypothetical protein